MTEQPTNQLEGGGSIPTPPLHLQLIPKIQAKECYLRWHYLKDKDFMSTFSWGVFIGKQLMGAISYGVPNAKEIRGLYTAESQKGWWELKRFALSPELPRNSESRVIAVSLRLLQAQTPVTGVVTYADSSVGHTGTIYRASNFTYLGLTALKTDLFINGVRAGKKGQYHRGKQDDVEEWRPRSRKHLFVRRFITTLN